MPDKIDKKAFDYYEDKMIETLVNKFGEEAVDKMFKDLYAGKQVKIPEIKE